MLSLEPEETVARVRDYAMTLQARMEAQSRVDEEEGLANIPALDGLVKN